MRPILERVFAHGSGAPYGWRFWCAGCEDTHIVPDAGGWQFNGSEERPTFSPSILLRQRWGNPPKESVCHSFVRDGQIQFLGDCTHKLASQTVPLGPIPEGAW